MKEYIIEKDVRRLPFAIKIEKENTNFTNFGRAVERERSELRNVSPKEQGPHLIQAPSHCKPAEISLKEM